MQTEFTDFSKFEHNATYYVSQDNKYFLNYIPKQKAWIAHPTSEYYNAKLKQNILSINYFPIYDFNENYSKYRKYHHSKLKTRQQVISNLEEYLTKTLKEFAIKASYKNGLITSYISTIDA